MIKKRKLQNYIIGAILLLAAAVRLIGLSKLPAGVLPDEAYGAYNAWGLMTEGMDSRGYCFPVYFVAWGSGMNALYSYLAIPFFYLFGVSTMVYRLPQAIVGIISVYAIYALTKELYEEKFALLAAFVLAINPWHIMNNRFGLESNLAPGMFLLGLLFLVLSFCKKRRYLIASAVFFGLTLYSYALTWLILPLFLLLCMLCYRGRIIALFLSNKAGKGGKLTLAGFTVILFLLALPLLLFVAVNMGWLDEVRTPYFSIPRLQGFRGEELDLAHIGESASEMRRILLVQYDGTPHTSSRIVGGYYLFTSPFMVIGLCSQIWSVCRMVWKKGKESETAEENGFQYIMLLWTISAMLVCMLNERISTIHINMLHIPAVFYGVYGIWRTAEIVRGRWLLPLCLLAWCLSFGIFLKDYITVPSGYFVDERADEALRRAQELSGGQVTIFDYTIIKYSYLLWKDKPSVSDYAQNAVYEGDPAWEELVAYGDYRYVGRLEDVTEDGVYILLFNYEDAFAEMGFLVEQVNDRYCIAYPWEG